MKTPPSPLKPRYVLDQSGNKTEVILTVSDYERLLAAWEEVVDSQDFAEARGSVDEFLNTDELRKSVLGDE